jgi:hypothetical protein
MEVIWVRQQVKNSEKQKYFFIRDWTGQISLIRLDNFAVARKSAGGADRRHDVCCDAVQQWTRVMEQVIRLAVAHRRNRNHRETSGSGKNSPCAS